MEHLMETRILERIEESKAELLKYMETQPDFLKHHTFYMISSRINELYLLLTSYKNEMIIQRRKDGKQNGV